MIVDFRTDPGQYRHWRLAFDGEVATLTMDVDPAGGLAPGYELKLNSYDLGVDIELHDAVQRLRFEHPEVRAVVLTSGNDKAFCAGANIRMLAAAPHPSKVNFCKFTNEDGLAEPSPTDVGGQHAHRHSHPPGTTAPATIKSSGGARQFAGEQDRLAGAAGRARAVGLCRAGRIRSSGLTGSAGRSRVLVSCACPSSGCRRGLRLTP
jgi:hypothetical protein